MRMAPRSIGSGVNAALCILFNDYGCSTSLLQKEREIVSFLVVHVSFMFFSESTSPDVCQATSFMYTVSQKHTQYTRLLIITLANIDRFEKLFHYQLPDEIFYEDHKDSPSHLKYVLHYLVNLENYNCCRFQRGILHARPQNLSCKYEASLIAQVLIF